MAQKSSYTEEDFEKHEAYLKRYPNAATWTTLEGKTIPVVLIKDDHLKNIITHLNDTMVHFPENSIRRKGRLKVLDKMKKELKKRLVRMGDGGKVLFGD